MANSNPNDVGRALEYSIVDYIQKNHNKVFELINKKPILPSNKEIKHNPPSRSAKLRFAKKINDRANFEEFLIKFENLLDIEKLGNKLC